MKASFLEGKPPKTVNMYWRRWHIRDIPIHNDKAFDIWLRARWTEKDLLIENFLRNGRFPADTGANKLPTGKVQRGAGYLQTRLQSNHWYEFLQIFAPIGLLSLVLYCFYGELPKNVWNSIQKQAFLGDVETDDRRRIQGPDERLITNELPKIQPKGFDRQNLVMKQLEGVSINGVPSTVLLDQLSKVDYMSFVRKIGTPTGDKSPDERRRALLEAASQAAHKEIPGLSKANAAQRSAVINSAAQRALKAAGSETKPKGKPSGASRKAMSDAGPGRRPGPISAPATPKAMSEAGFDRSTVAKGPQNTTSVQKAKPTIPQKPQASQQAVNKNRISQNTPAKAATTSMAPPKKSQSQRAPAIPPKKSQQQTTPVAKQSTAKPPAPKPTTNGVATPTRNVVNPKPSAASTKNAGTATPTQKTSSQKAPLPSNPKQAASQPAVKSTAAAKPVAKQAPTNNSNGTNGISLPTKQQPRAAPKQSMAKGGDQKVIPSTPKKLGPASAASSQGSRKPPKLGAGQNKAPQSANAAVKQNTAQPKKLQT